MQPFSVNGDVWMVVRVSPDSPSLIDRTGKRTIATTDPARRVVSVSTDIEPPFLDKVLLHEVAHAITISHGLLDVLRMVVPEDYWVFVEEWAAQLMENYGIEAVALTSKSLGRPACVSGLCYGQPDGGYDGI